MANKQIPAVTVTGCRADCPNTRYYDPNEDGQRIGCIHTYGTLPEKGMPDWCPLDDEPQQGETT